MKIKKLCKLCVTSIALVSVLVACATVGHNDGNFYSEAGVSLDSPVVALGDYSAQSSDSSLNTSDDVITILSESLFFGEGERVSCGGDSLQWYHNVFGFGFINIPGYFMDVVGTESFHAWTLQFTGENASRNPREAHLQTLIYDFSITEQDIINSMEAYFGLPMHEIDYLINWGRYGVHADIYERANAQMWAIPHSLNDIEALFSDNVYEVWAAFPGYGVVQNGRAYSPEWILNNIGTAIFEEQIPMDEIERIISLANYYPVLVEVTIQAMTELQVSIME